MMTVKDGISAFGWLIQTSPEAVEGCVEDLLKKLVTISMTEISLGAESDDDTFMGADADTMPFEAKIMVVRSAIRTMCCTVSVFTELLLESFGPISQAIERQVAVGSADHVIACARGAVFLVEGFQKIELNEQTKSFVVKLVQIPADIVSSELSQAEGAGQISRRLPISLRLMREPDSSRAPGQSTRSSLQSSQSSLGRCSINKRRAKARNATSSGMKTYCHRPRAFCVRSWYPSRIRVFRFCRSSFR